MDPDKLALFVPGAATLLGVCRAHAERPWHANCHDTQLLRDTLMIGHPIPAPLPTPRNEAGIEQLRNHTRCGSRRRRSAPGLSLVVIVSVRTQSAEAALFATEDVGDDSG